MRRLFVLNSIFMAVLMTASIARAAECTIERDVLGTALRQASSCVRAYRVFEACSFGTSEVGKQREPYSSALKNGFNIRPIGSCCCAHCENWCHRAP